LDLAGRTALVTGGALRVGRFISLELARRGANVVVNYRSSAGEAFGLVKELSDLGVGGLAVQADVSLAADVARLSAEARAEFGTIDVLVNNAAIYPRTPLDTLTEAAWDQAMNVNLKGPFLCCLEFGRRMKEQGEGVIVNLGDWAADHPYLDYLPYLTAKGAVVTLTRAFARELAPQVRVNAVAPGPIAPPPGMPQEEVDEARAGTLLGRWGSPQDIASAVAFLVQGSDFVTGAVVTIDGGRTIA
jgi:pteridine reductase